MRSEQSAIDFTLAIEHAIIAICTHPERSAIEHGYFREFIMRKYPFSVVYLHIDDPEMVYITSIWHHKRNPAKKYHKNT